jgi:hypothetical protein
MKKNELLFNWVVRYRASANLHCSLRLPAPAAQRTGFSRSGIGSKSPSDGSAAAVGTAETTDGSDVVSDVLKPAPPPLAGTFRRFDSCQAHFF